MEAVINSVKQATAKLDDVDVLKIDLFIGIIHALNNVKPRLGCAFNEFFYLLVKKYEESLNNYEEILRERTTELNSTIERLKTLETRLVEDDFSDTEIEIEFEERMKNVKGINNFIVEDTLKDDDKAFKFDVSTSSAKETLNESKLSSKHVIKELRECIKNLQDQNRRYLQMVISWKEKYIESDTMVNSITNISNMNTRSTR